MSNIKKNLSFATFFRRIYTYLKAKDTDSAEKEKSMIQEKKRQRCKREQKMGYNS